MQVITTHLNADFDALAAMVAAKQLYPEAHLVFSGSQERNLREFLGQALPYTYEFKRVRQIDLTKVTRLIVVDTRQARRLGNLAQCLDNPGIEIHIYDHHPDMPGDLHGSVEVVRPLGSTSTIFCQLFQERKIALSREDASLLLLGIYEDTGSFTFSTTTPDDLRAAAWLLAQGADLQLVSQFVSRELTSSQVALLNDLIRQATSYSIQGIDIVVAKLTMPEYVDEFSLIVRQFMVMDNLDCLFALAGMGDRIYLIVRSRIPEVNAGEIAREFGGGGHASAASATVKDLTMIEAEEKLVRLLHKHVRPQSVASELMSAPVISVGPNIAIREANEILTRYNITVLPVIKGPHKILGMISRRVVEKSIFHGLGDLPVSEYMTTDVATLPLSATLADIQEMIIEHRQRLIPVVDDQGGVKGVITRTDLLNLLVNDPGHIPGEPPGGEDRSYAERHRNLNSLMVEHLGREIIVLLRDIGEVAEQNQWAAYAVGGFVRDLLLRIKNLDLDIVVEGDGIAFAKKLAQRLGGKVRTHEKFKTAVVILANGFKIDVATARLEYYEYPAALPTVELSSIKLDLYRRDFTINAMAIHLNPDRFGTLVDFFNCQSDLKERRIRILHNLSFVEDPTRIFRAIRFEQRMGFQIGKHTEKMLKNAVKMNLFDRCRGRRCFGELKLIMSEEDPMPALRRMAGFDLLKFILPGLKLDKRLAVTLAETQKVLAWHRLLYLDTPCRSWMVYLLVVMAPFSMRKLVNFCARFEVPERYCLLLRRMKERGDKIVRVLNQGRVMRPSEIYWLLHGLEHEGLLYLLALARRKNAKKAVSMYVTKLRTVTTSVRGSDLKKMGYPVGPLYRTILNHLLEARLDGLVSTRAGEIAFVKKHYPLGPDQGGYA
ncbi:MAG: CBS domain-containing protein [Desulfobacterales bacterium]|nr:CBS domain-containing protein [Desulfobacterales bacterium]